MVRERATTADHWMGAPAAAKYLGIDLRTLYSIIDAGELAAYKIRRVIRLTRTDVEAYVERSRVAPGTLGHLYPPGHARPRTQPGAPTSRRRP